jgi:hypothetical protein
LVRREGGDYSLKYRVISRFFDITVKKNTNAGQSIPIL